jgi:predicted Rossmann-fold nucleotide-binding protein
MERKNIAFIGAATKRADCSNTLFEIGKSIAKSNSNLITGGVFWSADHVIDGFLSIPSQGKITIPLPKIEELKFYQEPTNAESYYDRGVHEVLFTELSCNPDNDLRGKMMIEKSDIVVSFTGGIGTLAEIKIATELQKPIIYFPHHEFEKTVKENNFIHLLDNINIITNPEDLFDKISNESIIL